MKRACSMTRLIGLAGVLFVIAPNARAAVCDKMMDAMKAVFSQPSASDTTIAVPGKPANHSRTVYDGTKFYVQIEGSWHDWPMTTQQMINQITEMQKKARSSCDLVGSVRVDDAPATLYTMHSVTERSTSDSRLWIADGSGLPLKAETRFTSGMTVIQAFQYRDIQAPSTVK